MMVMPGVRCELANLARSKMDVIITLHSKKVAAFMCCHQAHSNKARFVKMEHRGTY